MYSSVADTRSPTLSVGFGGASTETRTPETSSTILWAPRRGASKARTSPSAAATPAGSAATSTGGIGSPNSAIRNVIKSAPSVAARSLCRFVLKRRMKSRSMPMPSRRASRWRVRDGRGRRKRCATASAASAAAPLRPANRGERSRTWLLKV